MKFATIRFCELSSSMWIPSSPLSVTRFPGPSWFAFEPSTSIPYDVLPSSALLLRSVPTKLAATFVPVAPPLIAMPSPSLSTTTFPRSKFRMKRSPGAALAPMTFPVAPEPETTIPEPFERTMLELTVLFADSTRMPSPSHVADLEPSDLGAARPRREPKPVHLDAGPRAVDDDLSLGLALAVDQGLARDRRQLGCEVDLRIAVDVELDRVRAGLRVRRGDRLAEGALARGAPAVDWRRRIGVHVHGEDRSRLCSAAAPPTDDEAR